jgi:hypothetical protein
MRLKHARAARGLLQELEEDIRRFVLTWNEKHAKLQKEGRANSGHSHCEDEEQKQGRKLAEEKDQGDDDDDEIVFMGRNGRMQSSSGRKRWPGNSKAAIGVANENDEEKMVFESLVEDRGAGFGSVSQLLRYLGPSPYHGPHQQSTFSSPFLSHF